MVLFLKDTKPATENYYKTWKKQIRKLSQVIQAELKGPRSWKEWKHIKWVFTHISFFPGCISQIAIWENRIQG